MPRSLALVLMVASVMMTNPARAFDPISGDQLFADVKRYESFGLHRYGSPGAAAALDWIAVELAQARWSVTSQPFTMGRQYELESGSLTVDGRRLEVVPHWWIPGTQASFSLTAPIIVSGDASGGFVRLTLPFDRGAYLNNSHRDKLQAAFARRPAAVLLSIDHPSGEIFTYNVDQASAPWPVPVILVAPKDAPALDAAGRAGARVTVEIKGRYQYGVRGRNVVGRLDRGKGRWIVVSTPVTSWFTSACERGPGIAGFLAVARLAAERLPNVDLVFVATAGHEIGHGGMEHFMREGAPAAAATLAWAHFGSSLACRDTVVKVINSSSSMSSLVDRRFAGIEGRRLTGEKAAIGELREVYGAGYANFFGMAAAHKAFHTPEDSASFTGPALLAPMVRAYLGALEEIVASAQ
jgi:hypothetical protein